VTTGTLVEGTTSVLGTTGTAGTPAVSGKLDLVDIDNGDRFDATMIAGTYGSLSIAADGNWTYTLDNENPAVDALNVGQSLTDIVTVFSEDGTASQEITVTIEGRNDAPRLTGGFVRVGENSFQITVTDPDSGALTYTVGGGASLALNNGSPTTISANSTSNIEQRTIVVSDGAGGQLIVGDRVTGTTQDDFIDVPEDGLNTIIFGHGGNDTMRGGAGDDYLFVSVRRASRLA